MYPLYWQTAVGDSSTVTSLISSIKVGAGLFPSWIGCWVVVCMMMSSACSIFNSMSRVSLSEIITKFHTKGPQKKFIDLRDKTDAPIIRPQQQLYFLSICLMKTYWIAQLQLIKDSKRIRFHFRCPPILSQGRKSIFRPFLNIPFINKKGCFD